MEALEHALEVATEAGILIFEWVGLFVLLAAGAVGIVAYIRRKPRARLDLAHGIAAGLEFLLVSEVLRTILLRSMDEALIVSVIIAMRIALALLIHWEGKREQEDVEGHAGT